MRSARRCWRETSNRRLLRSRDGSMSWRSPSCDSITRARLLLRPVGIWIRYAQAWYAWQLSAAGRENASERPKVGRLDQVMVDSQFPGTPAILRTIKASQRANDDFTAPVL